MKDNEHYQNMVKIFTSFRYKYDIMDVFEDFIYMTAAAFSNSVDTVHYEKRETEYMRRINRYEKKDSEKFAEIISQLVMCFEVGGPNDYLGKLFMDLDMGNKYRGQYFTPYTVSVAMASMVFNERDVRMHINEKGYMSLYEPTCGAGGMIIAAYEVVKKMGFNPQQVLKVTSQDIDFKAVLMTYIQTTILCIDNTVILGNTLMMEQQEVWRTPSRFLRIFANLNKLHSKPEEITSELLDECEELIDEKDGQYVLAI